MSLSLLFVFSVIWLAFPGCAQVSMTWLNLLSVQPPGAHIISFPRLAKEAHGTHSLKRAIKDPGVSTGSVTLQIVRGKVIKCSFGFAIRCRRALCVGTGWRSFQGLQFESQIFGLATVCAHPPPVHREGAAHRYADLFAPPSALLATQPLGPPPFNDAILGLKRAPSPHA